MRRQLRDPNMRMLKVSFGRLKPTCDTRIIHFDYILEQTAQVGHGVGQRKKSKTGEDGSYHTAQVGPGDRGREKSKKNVIDIGVFKNKDFQGMSSLAL